MAVNLTPLKRSAGLAEVLAGVLAEEPEPRAIRRAVSESYQMALSYFLQKRKRSYLPHDLVGLTINDLALDCIADLFERDKAGRFCVLNNYFQSLGWQQLSEPELNRALRRLVLSKANEGLFRRYRESDPTLARIIRNVKEAIKAEPRLSLQRYHGDLWITLKQADTVFYRLPLLPVDLLESHFIGCLNANGGVGKAVASLVGLLSANPAYSPGYPLTMLARALHSAYMRTGDIDWTVDEPEVFLKGEVYRAIQRAGLMVERNMKGSYVAKGKVNAMTFDAYLSAVRDVLEAHYISDATVAPSLFDALRTYLPGLSKTVYHYQHRNRVEYLMKLAREWLFEQLRDVSQPVMS